MEFPLLSALLLLMLCPNQVYTQAPDCPDQCDLRACRVVSAVECEGTIVKDECNCCPVCQPAPQPDAYDDFYEDVEDGMMTPNYVNASHKELCAQITCTRLQTCTVNIQGIPMCRCPSAIYCRDQRIRRRGGGGGSVEVCAMDGKTYRSRCFLRMKECTENKRIKVKHDGPCFQDAKKKGKKRKGSGDDKENMKLQRRKNRQETRKELRKNEKLMQRQLRQEEKKEKRREEKREMKKQERREKKKAEKREERVVERKAERKTVKKESPKMKTKRRQRQKRRLRRRNANSKKPKVKKGKKRSRGRRSCSDVDLDLDTVVV